MSTLGVVIDVILFEIESKEIENLSLELINLFIFRTEQLIILDPQVRLTGDIFRFSSLSIR